MTRDQAYAAMFRFLSQYYGRTQDDVVGVLLGAMSIMDDGTPADPAITPDWTEAVEYALAGGTADRLVISPKRLS